MSVELTDKELAALYDDTICPDCGDGFAIRETLVPTVESIVQQRMTRAWREGYSAGVLVTQRDHGYQIPPSDYETNPYDEGNPA